MDDIIICVTKAKLRLGTEGLLYGMRNHAIGLKDLKLHSGTLRWTFDMEIQPDGLHIKTDFCRVSVGEMDLPTVKAESYMGGVVNFALALFARSIKDLIPAQVEAALKELAN